MPSKIELKVGEKYTLRLKGLAGAGYIWEYTIEADTKVVVVSTELPDHPLKAKSNIPTPGYSMDKIVTIQALEPGHATIHFVLHRSWEKNIPPLKEYILEIYVRS